MKGGGRGRRREGGRGDRGRGRGVWNSGTNKEAQQGMRCEERKESARKTKKDERGKRRED